MDINFDSAQISLIESAIKYTFENFTNISKKIGMKVSDKIKFEKAIRNYVENYVHRNGSIKILGMTKPISLKDLYINLETHSPTNLNKYESINSLELSYKNENTRRLNVHSKNRRSGVEVANCDKYLCVLGSPGSGKTTFLKKMGIESFFVKTKPFFLIGNKEESDLKYNYVHECIPVFIELKQFKYENINLIEIISEEFENCGFPDPDKTAISFLTNGKMLILLDGLDEVPNDKLNSIISHVKNFSDKYRNNRFIISCRTAFYRSYFSVFNVVEVSDFNDEQIIHFAQNWFSNKTSTEVEMSERFLSNLFNKEYQSALELARTPLLLTFLCLSFEVSDQLPLKRGLLYKRSLGIYLEKWNLEKGVFVESIHKYLNVDLELDMLSEIALALYKEEKIFFSKMELIKLISIFLSKNEKLKDEIGPSQVLTSLEVHKGIFVERTIDIYSFCHLTIQEYLVAHYFQSKNITDELVDGYLFNPKWNEILLLFSGISNSDQVLRFSVNSLNDYSSKNDMLIHVFFVIDKHIIQEDNEVLNFSRRVFITIFLLLYVRDSNETNKMDNFSHFEEIPLKIMKRLGYDVDFKLYKNLNRKRTVSILQQLQKFTFLSIDIVPILKKVEMEEDLKISGMPGSRNKQNRRFINLVLECLGFDTKFFSFGSVRMKPLIDYLQICDLIIRCKQESIIVDEVNWRLYCKKLLSNFEEHPMSI
ncbi:NACHT domain-containing protein [Algoriphagus winogradskyi]|uniref:NACHT domain-containing protein n=1 Tax=Algoriphagus winogradskyi TaxID=237017 RepID=A0ABY1P848_9BACT|nr:hypothetical protein [Algoriphagus winogradskyi]SMP26348.1 hypothetical protein SAMN06265367_104357 [Algoriphagus winogradskyi]